MSVLSGNGGGAWKGDGYSGRHRREAFDVPWLCPDLAVCVGRACEGPGCLRVQRGAPEQGAYPEAEPGTWPPDVISRYGDPGAEP